MSIAILGWGSLLWEQAPDFDCWRGAWQLDGPVLSLEFSRISKSRSGALTLVVDPEHGTPNRVAWCCSRRHALEPAIDDLRRREGTTTGHIGAVGRSFARVRSRHPPTNEAVLYWTTAHGLDAAIWTDLPSNFGEKTGRPFSVPAAIDYLQSLDPAARERAFEYIRKTPPFIRTPLRGALRAELQTSI